MRARERAGPAWWPARPSRRWLPGLVPALLLAGACRTAPPPRVEAPPAGPDEAAARAFLDTLQQRTFDFFWETTPAGNGLTPDRWPTPSFSSIAAVGFALSAYLVGVENGWITRDEAAERTLATLRFFWEAPQGDQPAEVTGYRGFFYHFLDMETGHRFETVELSTIDTTLLLAGILSAQVYFDGAEGREREIRALADSIYFRVDWPWAQARPPSVSMGWRPERGYVPADWRGYNEAMILLILALGSPTHPIGPESWHEWTSTYRWGTFYGEEHLGFAPLFGQQYSHVWIDFRGIQDSVMRHHGIDYFENSRRATVDQRAYAIDNPDEWRGYGPNIWGLTACDGPADTTVMVDGRPREFHTYWARGAGPFDVQDDGTIAPTAAGGSIPFAPEIAVPALFEMRHRFGDHLWGEYGFRDAFNLTFDDAGIPPEKGTVVPGVGWFDVDYLGIDQGPIVLMIENHREEFLWDLMKQSPYVVTGLCRAGFRGGWLAGRCGEGAGTVAGREAVLVDSLLGLMTLDEKLGQLAQYSARWNPELRAPEATSGHLAMVREGRVGSFLSLYGAEVLRELQRVAVEESRLGIPLLFAHDVIHGFRTVFPVPLAEAATWDPEVVERAARVAAVEATGAGVHWTFAPMVDVARDPRWGRIVEGSGEDPYLGSVLARARVRGFQGEDLADPTTLLATAKHYVAYGGAEGGRDYNTVDISERTLHEIYLPPFRAAVDEGVESVMAAFNEIGGVPMHAHDGLIDGLLREEWGWDGVLVSDYTGVLELIRHGVADDSVAAGILALEAGVDIDMMGGIYGGKLAGAVRAGRLDEADVDEAVRRVLGAKAALGLFEDPYRYSDPARERAVLLTDEHRRAAREVARKAIVLLQNDGTLPFGKEVGSVAVIGPLADDRDAPLGPWAGAGRVEEVVTVLEGIRSALPEATIGHAKGVDAADGDTTGFAEAVRLANGAGAVVLVLGESRELSGEAASRHTLDLPGAQLELARRILAVGKPTAVVLMNGRPLAIPWLAENAPAILETWFLGTETGPAVADVLFGDVSPGGKLPVTFPRAVGQVPIYYNHKSTGRPPSEEKYTSKYLDLPSTPLYPFGHGLGYTTFEYANARVSGSTMTALDTLTVSVDLTNAGGRTGDEVVQLYLRDPVRSVTPPVMELKGFERVTLAPGETLTVSFPVTMKDLAFYDADGWWRVEPGAFVALLGGSSAETLEVPFEATEGATFRYVAGEFRLGTEREADR